LALLLSLPYNQDVKLRNRDFTHFGCTGFDHV
jgi:hypothetical protein